MSMIKQPQTLKQTRTPDIPDGDNFSISRTSSVTDQLPSPARPALIIAALLVCGEVFIMYFIMPLFAFPLWVDAVVNALFLLLILIAAYFYVFRPFWFTYQAATDEIHNLNRQLLLVSEKEREHLAAELHDDAAQYLTALKLAVAALTRTPATTSAEVNAGNVRHLTQLVDETQERLRWVVTKLRPPNLDAGSPAQALDELIKRCELQFPQVQISFTNNGCQDTGYTLIDVVLYRICQEGLCNAVRHAGATQIDIIFSCQAQQLKLQINDDGHGFEPTAAQHSNGGINGMRKRLAAVGGTLSIESRPGQGSRLLAIIPIEKGARQ